MKFSYGTINLLKLLITHHTVPRLCRCHTLRFQKPLLYPQLYVHNVKTELNTVFYVIIFYASGIFNWIT